jgi:excisionase family DNA binding protein
VVCAAQSDLLTPAEVADYLRLSRKAIYQKIGSGDLPAVRLGDGPFARIRVPLDALDRVLNERLTPKERAGDAR